MIRRILIRVGWTIPLVLVVCSLVFFMMHLAPGDPAIRAAGGTEATPEAIASARHRLGLDQPLMLQYLQWLSGIVRGDLGTSLFSSQTVSDALMARLPINISLTAGAMVVAIGLAIPAGVVAAIRAGGIIDRMLMAMTTAGIAMPSFLIGLTGIYLFAIVLPWFPALGYVPLSESLWGWGHHLILPWLALGFASGAEIARHMRSAFIDVLEQDYIVSAFASGLPRLVVYAKHALKNAAVPVVTSIGLQVGQLLGGSVIVETIFSMRGLGSLAIRSVVDRDFPMIQGIALISALIVIAVNLVTDLSYSYFNPKIRTS